MLRICMRAGYAPAAGAGTCSGGRRAAQSKCLHRVLMCRGRDRGRTFARRRLQARPACQYTAGAPLRLAAIQKEATVRRKLTAGFMAVLLGMTFTAPAAAGALPVPVTEVPDEAPAVFVIDSGGFARSVASVTAELRLEGGSDVRAYIYDAEVPPETNIATGLFLHWITADGTAARSAQVAVLGDVLGTGEAGIGQLTRMARAFTGTDPLEGIWLTAGDLDGSGQIDLPDVVQCAEQLRTVMDTEDGDLHEQMIPMYLETPQVRTDLPLYFAADQTEIPYISAATMKSVLSRIFASLWAEQPAQLIASGRTVTIRRQNGAEAVLDFAAQEIRFADRNAFFSAPDAGSVLDIVSAMPVSADGTPRYIERVQGSFGRKGRPVTVALTDYGIPISFSGSGGCIPLQTFSDVFLTPLGCSTAYNGRGVFLGSLREPNALLDLYYEAPASERSAALCAFTYNEFCLAMDMYYGFKEQQNIGSFDALLRQTGLYDALHSEDAAEADTALKTLADGYLGDVHTRLMAPSFYAGRDAEIRADVSSIAIDQYRKAHAQATQARLHAYPSGRPFYEEVGHTAFVTLDTFSFDSKAAYETSELVPSYSDTVSTIAYAHQQITRADSPITTVVLDLSCNSGGDLDGAVYALGWLLGTATVSLNDSQTGAQATVRFRSDINLDGRYTADDSISGLNCVCLVSPASFSAANLAATVLKGTTVQIVGQRTSGGSCAVLPLTLADGTVMRISGPTHASALENGSYYDTDRGVAPDFRLRAYADFYDRDSLCRRLDQIFAVREGGDQA